MPLGDPHGGEFIYTYEGIPTGISAFTVPSKNIDRSVRFYTECMRMTLRSSDAGSAVMQGDGFLLNIVLSDATGVDTGVYLATDRLYDLHRRLIDEGVIFVLDPIRGPLGVCMTFKDDDGNLIHAMDVPATKV